MRHIQIVNGFHSVFNFTKQSRGRGILQFSLPCRSFQRLNPRSSLPLNLDKLFPELTMCRLSYDLQNVLQYLRLLSASCSGKFVI
jgi:hypothetical protein